MSKAYWVVRANVRNSEEYSKYDQIATDIIAKYNGNFLIRGGDQIEFEESGFERTVVVEFNSFEDALECYKSYEYQVNIYPIGYTMDYALKNKLLKL